MGPSSAAPDYGLDNPGPKRYWPISSDPHHPHVGFQWRIDAGAVESGRHWLGLRLHGSDGSVEDWSEQPMRDRVAACSRAPVGVCYGKANPARRSSCAVAISGKPTSAVGSRGFDRFEQRDAQAFGLEAAGAVEGLLGIDVAYDLRRQRGCGIARRWCRPHRSDQARDASRTTQCGMPRCARTSRPVAPARLHDRLACPAAARRVPPPGRSRSPRHRLHARRPLRPWPRPGVAPDERRLAGERGFRRLPAGRRRTECRSRDSSSRR